MFTGNVPVKSCDPLGSRAGLEAVRMRIYFSGLPVTGCLRPFPWRDARLREGAGDPVSRSVSTGIRDLVTTSEVFKGDIPEKIKTSAGATARIVKTIDRSLRPNHSAQGRAETGSGAAEG